MSNSSHTKKAHPQCGYNQNMKKKNFPSIPLLSTKEFLQFKSFVSSL
jgi:hypothetical protein